MPCRYPAAVRDRDLLDRHGDRFFWLGDTAWELIHYGTADEVRHYAEVRARQGFNVVQTVILAELDGLRVPNANGDLPLVDLDPTDPNPAYFKHVDLVVRTLNDAGLVACLLPTWGDKVNLKWGPGPVVFDDPDQAAVFGDFLGDRYRDAAVVWMLGGDRACESPVHRQVYGAMAAGLKYGHGGRHLITYHPGGGSTGVDALGGDPDWCDFHCTQSGHASNRDVGGLLRKLREQTTKPTLDAEPAYEGHPKMSPDWQTSDGRWSAAEVLAGLREAIEVGGCGVTYGHHAVWQMWDLDRPNPLFPEGKTAPPMPWREALRDEVANFVGNL